MDLTNLRGLLNNFWRKTQKNINTINSEAAFRKILKSLIAKLPFFLNDVIKNVLDPITASSDYTDFNTVIRPF